MASKERPIIMTSENARAILDGRKTQTRRTRGLQHINENPNRWVLGKSPESYTSGDVAFLDMADPIGTYPTFAACPYGVVGDRLWVRESYHIDTFDVLEQLAYGKYLSDGTRFLNVKLTDDEAEKFCRRKKPHAKTSGRFMYKSLARLWLEITGIRVERVQEITPENCEREGLTLVTNPNLLQGKYRHILDDFKALWDSINAKPKPVMKNSRLAKLLLDNEALNRIVGNIAFYVSYPWEDVQELREYRGKKWYVYGNPHVWVIEFRKADCKE